MISEYVSIFIDPIQENGGRWNKKVDFGVWDVVCAKSDTYNQDTSETQDNLCDARDQVTALPTGHCTPATVGVLHHCCIKSSPAMSPCG